jgi:hypothetical protein
MSSAIQKIPLLDLTPVCLQNTNNIINTLIFMCLDQGHDFRDKSARTLNKGKRGWVDIDFRGAGYLNKISQDDLNSYASTDGENIIDSAKIFGKYQFVTGLINTTFMGGNGAYGLVLVDDENYNIISSESAVGSETASATTISSYDTNTSDDTVSNFIVNQLSQQISGETIKFYLENFNDDNYFILSQGDDYGGEGKTITNQVGGKEVSLLFLPLYKRAYNKGMHNLWEFNTKKHIFVVSLDEMCIKRENDEFSIDNSKTKISCKKLTTIDLIVPTYTLDNFDKAPKGSKGFLSNLTDYMKDKKASTKDAANESDKLFSSITDDKIAGSQLDNLFLIFKPQDKEAVLNYFLRVLFTGTYTVSEPTESEDPKDEIPSIEYKIGEDGIGYFTIKNYDDIKLYQCVPRGVKYWFNSCQQSAFKHFIRLLYSSQKPFIHPEYNIRNAVGELEDSKKYILDTLLNNSNVNLNNYISYKNGETFDVKSPFILKQYGVIPDTTIGNTDKHTTINFLINSLNNVSNNISCDESKTDMVGGGELYDKLKDILPDTKDLNEIKTIEANKNFTIVSRSVKKIYQKLTDKKTKQILIDYVKDALKDEVEDEEIEILFRKLDESESKPESKPDTRADLKDDGMFDKLSDSSSQGATTGDSASVSADDKDIKTFQPLAKEDVKDDDLPADTTYFNNIENVNEAFDLHLEASIKDEPFVEISSKMPKQNPNENIEFYEKEYSNSLQQYYEFIPQKGSESSSSKPKNYFNNCWQTIDFFQENPLENKQTGGNANYPYRFTVTSGQIDGSLQGGQSIPQYHPPEVDIYMPIFELNGGNLKGIIARMVFVKEILANAINSKSRAVVFCHFAYVDFESTGVKPPINVSEYPRSLKELLDYTIKNTYYIKDNDDCINLETLNQTEDINSDDQIDFQIELIKPETSSVRVRKWYKYYTYTSGPGVKEHFVPPTDYSTINEILYFSKDVANRIASVGDKLIKNSRELRKVFGAPENPTDPDIINKNQGAVLFVKLFLIRNKYTGDKSRATDTLFLNQTKYLEGIQISNDENTLFNALMFGQNTIWSTSAKTVFNMAPYLTKRVLTDGVVTEGGKMPVNGGFYIDILCKALRGNPSIKAEAPPTEESASDDALVRTEINESIISKIPSNVVQNCQLNFVRGGYARDFVFGLTDIIIKFNKFQEKYNDLSEFYNNYDKMLNNIGMEQAIIAQNSQSSQNIMSQTWSPGKNLVQVGKIDDLEETGVEYSIIATTGKALTALTNVKNELKGLFNLIIGLSNNIKACQELSIENMYSLFFYIIENIPWWNIQNYQTIIINRYCYMCSAYLCKAVNICKRSGAGCYQKVVDFFNNRKKDMEDRLSTDRGIKTIVKNCLAKFVFGATEVSSTKVVAMDTKPTTECSLEPKKPEETDILQLEVSNNEDTKEIEEKKLQLLVLKIINNLSSDTPDIVSININTISSLDNLTEINREISNLTDTITLFRQQKIRAAEVGETASIREQPTGTDTRPKRGRPKTTGGMNGEQSSIIDANVLNLFYENSYKCNVGNYLKSFITKIKSINEKYVDVTINENDTINDIVIKILLKDINFINSSYLPVLTTDKIIDKLNKVDETYTVQQMNTIKNLYSGQLELYSLIDTVIVMDYDDINVREYLANLVSENIDDNRYIDLKLPFTKQELLEKIINKQQLQSDIPSPIQKSEETTETQTSIPMPNPWSNKTERSQNDVSNIDFSNLLKEHGIIPEKSSQTRKYPNYSEKLDDFGQSSNYSTSLLMAHGGSIKNKRKQINTTRNNKRKNKKRTIKRRNVKVKRYTRRR